MNSQSKNLKKMKKGEENICPICTEVIIEGTDKVEHHDAINCVGTCDSWLHRQCAGLLKPVFQFFVNSDKPYQCPHCRLATYESMVDNMKSIISSLVQ